MQVKSSKPSLLACLLALTKYETSTKLGAVIQVPFRAGNQFLGEGGLQDIYDIRDKHLQKLRTEINAHIKNVQNDTGKLATNVAKERELSTRLIAELSAGISAFKNTPMAITSKIPTSPTPPSSANSQNKFTKRTSNNPLASCSGTARTSRRASSTWQTYDEWQARAASSIAQTPCDVAAQWPRSRRTASGSRSALRPSARSRDPAAEPEHDYRAAGAQESYMRAYRESFFVLTSARFLHEYASSDPMSSGGKEPLFSLFLPMYTLGPPCAASAKSRKFHIEGRKHGSRPTKGGNVPESEFEPHARRGARVELPHAESRGYDGVVERRADAIWSGPVAATVRAAGYVSEEQDGGSEEGTSVEEEDTETGLEYADAEDGEGPGPPSNTGASSAGDGDWGERIPAPREWTRAPALGLCGGSGRASSRFRAPSPHLARLCAMPARYKRECPPTHVARVLPPLLPGRFFFPAHIVASPPRASSQLRARSRIILTINSDFCASEDQSTCAHDFGLLADPTQSVHLFFFFEDHGRASPRKRPTAPAPRAPAENTSRACLSVTYAHTTPSARAGGDARSASDNGVQYSEHCSTI
ncbi:hypothetical protein B0H11DRAFT_1914414 [Mycena galericulata]|nr:hypothetical protein B0H11DRAFT_1914414 [Mycena galericulata]